jgi:signal transduction histidine kinase
MLCSMVGPDRGRIGRRAQLPATEVEHWIDFGRGSAPADRRTLSGPMTGAEHHEPAGVAQWQRPLLPAALLEEPGARRTPRDWLVDALMYAVSGAFGVAILGATAGPRSDVMIGIDIAAGIVAFAALWFRRRRPAEVAVVVIALSCCSGLAAGAALAALFNAALRMAPRPLAGIAALNLAAALISAGVYGNPSGYDWGGLVIGLLLTIVVLGWGLFARAQRDLVRSLHERAQRFEAERRLHEEQARDAERRRIAREMHDVLAHRISLLSVHAGALEFRPDAPPEEIAEAAGVVRGAAQAALHELRDVIGVLRDDQDGSAGAHERTEPPQPTLADIPALVQESREAGARVALRIDASELESVPAGLGRTAYRIVQEGLTNARKHAPAAAVDVEIAGGDGQLAVNVVSRWPVGVVARAGTTLPTPGAGTGLIGLAERVALSGGTLEHGLDLAGDFVLRATLPWTA